jgi:hypothetical protein
MRQSVAYLNTAEDPQRSNPHSDLSGGHHYAICGGCQTLP